MLGHFGRIDVLVNCAGRGYDAPLEQVDVGKYRELFQLDVVGPVIAMQLVIPIMRRQGGGMIVNISSGTSLMYLPNMSAYSSVKRALNSITLTAREEPAKDHIVVSVVYPYITLTDLDKNMFGVESGDFDQPEADVDANLPPPDSAEYVAEKMQQVIETEEAEQFVHDWMKRPSLTIRLNRGWKDLPPSSTSWVRLGSRLISESGTDWHTPVRSH